jgi:hypothetical protein
MLIDIIWKAFERTGDTRYYLEYRKCKDICNSIENSDREKKMDKTG